MEYLLQSPHHLFNHTKVHHLFLLINLTASSNDYKRNLVDAKIKLMAHSQANTLC